VSELLCYGVHDGVGREIDDFKAALLGRPAARLFIFGSPLEFVQGTMNKKIAKLMPAKVF